MYLSRVEINTRLRDTLRALASPEIMHAIVMNSFPCELANSEGTHKKERVLWRIDKLSHSTYLLVLSQRKPDFSHIIEQIGWPATTQTWETKDYTDLLKRLQKDQVWQFRLVANPVKSQKNSANKVGDRGKINPHITIEHQTNWLLDRTAKNGFEVLPSTVQGTYLLEISNRNRQSFRRESQTVTIQTATFDGILKISDVEKFKDALINGLGRAKAYGCGLMTIAKPK